MLIFGFDSHSNNVRSKVLKGLNLVLEAFDVRSQLVDVDILVADILLVLEYPAALHHGDAFSVAKLFRGNIKF
jgi:hypothetical protein